VPRPEQYVVERAVFSPDGKTLATAFLLNQGDEPAKLLDSIVLWDARSGARLKSFRPTRLPVHRMFFFSDGEYLLVSAHAGTLEIWHIPSGSLRYELRDLMGGSTYKLTAVTVAPHGLLLASQARHKEKGHPQIVLWETTTGKPVHAFDGFATTVTSLTFAADGRFLVSGHADGTAFVWDLLSHPSGKSQTVLDTQLWHLLGGEPARAYRTLWAAAQSRQVVPFLKTRLRPVPVADETTIKQWIMHLGSPSFARRDQASKQLLQLGVVAVPSLRQVLQQPLDLETRRRIQTILMVVDPREPSQELVRELRAIHLLELQGTPEAREILKELARGHHDHPTTRAAAAAVQRGQGR
jgi:hypothetical protein